MLFLSICAPIFVEAAYAQPLNLSTALVRMQRQNSDENICMLVHKDRKYHLERLYPGFGQTRIYEGTLQALPFSELQEILNSDDFKNLTQAKIQMALVGEDRDQLLVAVRRDLGWQSLQFTTGASRKPFRSTVEPLVKWLDRNKQQENALSDAVTNGCVLPVDSTHGSGAVSTSAQVQPSGFLQASVTNPYLLRIVTDHIETSPNDMPNYTEGLSARVERVCIVIYSSGRYRRENSKQEYGDKMRTQVFLDSLDDKQVMALREILNDPGLKRLQHTTSTATSPVREGEIVNLAIWRGSTTQMLSFASLFGVQTQQSGMRDNLGTTVDEELNNIKPLRKWLKAHVESKKTPQVRGAASTNCVPSQQPE
jgi:hypothetical protein